ncbi:unnamed protein product, partial [Nesidiocoris tenuis]
MALKGGRIGVEFWVNSVHFCWPDLAKGRTNIELREQFILADNVSQSMSAFKPKLSTERKTPTPTSNTGPITK